MLGTVALDQRACLFKLHTTRVHVCSTFPWPAAQASLPQGQQTHLPLRMFDDVALDQHSCLKKSSYVCNSFTRLAGMLQYPCFKHCFEPSGMFVAVAPNHLARGLQLTRSACMFVRVASTSRFVWISCSWLTITSVVVWLNQQVYMLHLRQTCRYVRMLVPNKWAGKHNCARPSWMYFIVAHD